VDTKSIRLGLFGLALAGSTVGCAQFPSLGEHAWKPKLPFVQREATPELPPVTRQLAAAPQPSASGPAQGPVGPAASKRPSQQLALNPPERPTPSQPQRGRLAQLGSAFASGSTKAFERVKSTFRGEDADENPFQAEHLDQPTAPTGEHQQAAFQSRPAPPHAVHALLVHAQSQERAGNVLAAAEFYEKALALDGSNLDVLLGYARLQDRRGNFAEATRLYRTATERHPQEATALNDLALCLARQGRRDEAAQVMHESVRLQPDRKLYRNNYAKILVDLGRIDEALEQLAAAHEPAAAHYNLGYLLSQRGDQQSIAARHFARALELNPSLTDARRWLDVLGAPAPPAVVIGREEPRPGLPSVDRPGSQPVLPGGQPAARPPAEPATAYQSGLQPAPYFPPSRY
jgi:Tfp pilus assembly protein PilF